MDNPGEFKQAARELIREVTSCLLCGLPVKAKISKLKKPYFSCPQCLCRVFLNSTLAANALRNNKVARGTIPHYAKYVQGHFQQSRKKKDSDQSIRRALSDRGDQCVICRSVAELRWDKRGKPYQRCYVCCSFIFMSSQMAISGFLTATRIK